MHNETRQNVFTAKGFVFRGCEKEVQHARSWVHQSILAPAYVRTF